MFTLVLPFLDRSTCDAGLPSVALYMYIDPFFIHGKQWRFGAVSQVSAIQWAVHDINKNRYGLERLPYGYGVVVVGQLVRGWRY